VTVPATASPATVSSAFLPGTVAENGTTTWVVGIANPNTSTTLTDVRVQSSIPITTAYIVPDAMTDNTCGGSAILYEFPDPLLITTPGVDYGGGSIAPGASCAIAVTMTPEQAFDQAGIGVTVVSNEGGASAVSNATLTSLAPPPASVPGTTPPKPPSNAFTHTKPKLARDGTITETVKLPGKGTVRLRETWRGKLIAHAQKTVKTGKKLTIKLVPSTATRRALKAHHAATVKLSMAYTPTGGKTRTATLTERTAR
jgi:hypothetical protein